MPAFKTFKTQAVNPSRIDGMPLEFPYGIVYDRDTANPIDESGEWVVIPATEYVSYLSLYQEAAITAIRANEAAKEAEKLLKQPKIYDYIDLEKHPYENLQVPPLGHDFRTGLTTNLQKKFSFDQIGSLVLAEYFSDVAMTDKVVECSFVYTFDAYGDVESRIKTVTWFNRDGTPNDTQKIMPKTYLNPSDKLRVGRRRRSNVLDETMYVVRAFIVQSMFENGQITTVIEGEMAAIEWYSGVIDAWTSWVDVGDTRVRDLISNDTETVFMDNIITALLPPEITIRQYMINALDMATNPGGGS
jgi:hypothetical protein